jgi:hypothetical protein
MLVRSSVALGSVRDLLVHANICASMPDKGFRGLQLCGESNHERFSCEPWASSAQSRRQ